MTSGPLTILVADGDDGSRRFVAEHLRVEGHLVVESFGSDALREGLALRGAAAVARSVDLIISDVNMRDAAGWESLEEIRAQLPSIAILLMGEFIGADARENAERLNVSLISKPIRLGELSRRVSALSQRLGRRLAVDDSP